eukprot:1734287-Pleurochrysis_carterae.AAC.1
MVPDLRRAMHGALSPSTLDSGGLAGALPWAYARLTESVAEDTQLARARSQLPASGIDFRLLFQMNARGRGQGRLHARAPIRNHNLFYSLVAGCRNQNTN